MTQLASDSSRLRPLNGPASRTDLVADSIRTAILAGELRPGETLVERRLSELLGVSKTPVREALIGMAHTGLVTVVPNKGITVRALSLEDVRKVYEVRRLLEPWAARMTTTARAADVVQRAQDALNEAAGLLSAGDNHDLSMANRRFHRALYAGCGNSLVIDQLDALQDLTALGVVNLLWDRWPTWREEFVEHAEILAAVNDGNADEAERLVGEHIQRSLTNLESAEQAES
ncbi:GntR family transcriptional regulator [Saccharopolyspora flava]|uniref:DNA-binding transcriptional regulator, GntR family n=1 Tax=Saccharopolyspora flava TaxID=95161 RepID=A0A1I6P8Z6_9PSEU|nr:GntR family transcriptional regulator [Saccharopolyspora flava]SFS36667.1 DNA-binding transcriptional regulator, GntR family [Saccharopolyspora flava]